MPRLPDPLRAGCRHGRLLVLVVALGVVATSASGCESTGAGADAGPSASLQATEVADPADQVTNGIDAVPAEDALELARAALTSAQSFRVTGSPSQDQSLDLLFVAGSPVGTGEPDSSESDSEGDDATAVARGARGTVTRDGSTFQLRAVDGAVYVRGDLDWLADEVAASARRTLGGKWLLLPDPVAQNLSAISDPVAFVDGVLTPTGEVQSAGVSVIDAVPAAGIRFVDSEVTAWLSGVGTPYPLLVERLGATAQEGVVRFGGFDQPASLSAPRAANVVVAPESSSG